MISQVIYGILGTILTTLAGWAVAKLTAFLESKIKDKTALKFITDATDVITGAVKATYQTYVESIKGTELWNLDAQKTALNKAKDIALAELSEGAKEYITKNYGDLNTWIETKIESSIYTLKNETVVIAEDTSNKEVA